MAIIVKYINHKAIIFFREISKTGVSESGVRTCIVYKIQYKMYIYIQIHRPTAGQTGDIFFFSAKFIDYIPIAP